MFRRLRVLIPLILVAAVGCSASPGSSSAPEGPTPVPGGSQPFAGELAGISFKNGPMEAADFQCPPDLPVHEIAPAETDTPLVFEPAFLEPEFQVERTSGVAVCGDRPISFAITAVRNGEDRPATLTISRYASFVASSQGEPPDAFQEVTVGGRTAVLIRQTHHASAAPDGEHLVWRLVIPEDFGMTVIQAEGLNREELLDVAARLAEEEVTSAAEQLERLRARNRELETLVAELDAKVKELEFRNRYLAERLSPEDRVVDLINPNYPPAVGGEPGWEYHQTLTADLDGDGVDERVSVTTNAFWMPDEKEFGWDDGHPWHVYVEEPDGTRTYLFSNWVQLGRLDVILDREGPGLFIVYWRAGGLVIYRATYQGPDQFRTVLSFEIPLSDFATWADITMFFD